MSSAGAVEPPNPSSVNRSPAKPGDETVPAPAPTFSQVVYPLPGPRFFGFGWALRRYQHPAGPSTVVTRGHAITHRGAWRAADRAERRFRAAETINRENPNQ